MRNPFKPTFGASPPLLVGRDEQLAEFAGALDDGPGSMGRATIYTGARGAGKTVMLNAAEDLARERGWLVVSETAAPGVIERLTQSRLPELLRQFDPDSVRRRLTGVVAPFTAGGGATWETIEQHVVAQDLRAQITLLTDVLAEHETGLLITLDEIHRNRIDELRVLATTVQHAFREDRELAFAAAGLNAAVSDLLSDEVLTFLRRADRYQLGEVDMDDVKRALREPIERAGRHVGVEALELMAAGTNGYPFLIQLVGAQTWRVHHSTREITVKDAEIGVANARRRIGSLVYAPAIADASDIDKTFLLAMAKDDGVSKMSDLRERLDVSKQYAAKYRRRLIEAELIQPVGHGCVDFTMPYLRDYLREHAASLGV